MPRVHARDGVVAVAVIAAGTASLALTPAPDLIGDLPHGLIAWVLPLAAGATYLILRNVGKPARETSTAGYSVVTEIGAYVAIFIVVVHVLMVASLAEIGWVRALGPRSVVVLFGAFVIAVGNLLPRTRQNLAIGIRTRRALSDRRVWARTHRVSGYAAVALGGVIAMAGLLLAGPPALMVINAAALAGVVAVGLTYKRAAHD